MSVLLAFALSEVGLVNLPRAAQATVALAWYAFVLIVAFRRLRVGIAYFTGFSLLAVAGWSHVAVDADLPANFWGLRIGGISFNIAFAAALAALCLVAKRRLNLRAIGPGGLFLGAFIAYSLLAGILWSLFGVNHWDNFTRDALSYVPFVFWAYFIGQMRPADAFAVFRHGLVAAIVAMWVSYLSGSRFVYGGQDRFVLMSSIGFLAIFAVPFCRAFYSRRTFWALLLSVAGLLGTGDVFIGGKMIIIALSALFWLMYRSRRWRWLWAAPAIALAVVLVPAGKRILAELDESSLLHYKLRQLLAVAETRSLAEMASAPTSMGNLVAEAVTTTRYLVDRPYFLLLGKGFGGGVEDVYGYLAPLAKPGYGYAPVDATRNDFVRLHLPVYEVVLKGGVLALIAYAMMLIRGLRRHYTFGFFAAILLFTVFYVSKEMLLLTTLMLRLENLQARASAAARAVLPLGAPAQVEAAST